MNQVLIPPVTVSPKTLPTSPLYKMVKPYEGALGGMIACVALIGAFAAPAVPTLTDWGMPSSTALSQGWIVSAVSLVIFCAAVGIGINGRAAGLLIDNRNRVSLSKFQATAWTVVVLSAFITAVAAQLRLKHGNAAGVIIPGNLLAVMGISATSLVLSPAILSLKSSATAPTGQTEATAEKLDGNKSAGDSSVGLVYARSTPNLAQWLDMLRGDETGNAAYPDLGKIQQFLITVSVMGAYCFGLWSFFQGPSQNSLPDFDGNTAILIGVSHAGYLAYKAAPHSRSSATTAGHAPTDNAVG